MSADVPLTKLAKASAWRSRAILIAIAGLFVFALICNWGIWRSTSSELTGIEFPVRQVYRTDTSGRGRDVGFFVVVYVLPDDVAQLLEQNRIDLSQHPRFDGLEFDGYTRVNWTRGFPRDAVESEIYRHFQDSPPAAVPFQSINSDHAAEQLANSLLKEPDTLCAGWYKRSRQPGVSDPCIPHFYWYVLNVRLHALIMFGLDT